ncbi:MarR family winged helix-turn-helix transcriptional regulator [Papillibacter cinnamivorans]|uniref:DNA-binding transcriptional regulator, MarR family n=1 Tax=Papillibacter cinnamivorans DSM 12816 TaxID=1122930 RepID=A0A1W2AH53_9FIRM|nr:MarR family transcriptional regulator [Papillibacter cinnamivorans]SMC60025.1 DNA-binding transcriptional regulator, MarR family [Papillibacter cinnamivorans DSM 12816]
MKDVLNAFEKELNDILVDTFRTILRVDEDALKSTGVTNLSISEMHLLESVGKSGPEGRTISDIAQELSVTLPTVTVAINKLEKKGYVQKVKSGADGRMVFVTLTRLGQKMDRVHRYFHEQMVRNISSEMEEEEKRILTMGIVKLNQFFKRKSLEMEK